MDEESQEKLEELKDIAKASKSKTICYMIEFFYERKDRIRKGLQLAI